MATGSRGADGPVVSVVMPTRNRARWVERAVESVLSQTHPSLELLVVDDGSSDDTLGRLERFGERIAVLSQPHAGPYAARNLGVRHATGDLIAFIDSDDAWHPDRLASQLPLMRRPEVGLVFGDAAHVSPSAAPAAGRRRTCFTTTPPSRGRVARDLVWGNFVPTVAVLVRRACLEEVGGFPTSHEMSADYLTWFRIATRHELDYVNRPLVDYTVHAAGISNDLGRALTARIELFSAELERATDPAVQAMLQRLLFNLGVHLALATVRGRARSVPDPWRVARNAVQSVATQQMAAWTAAFFLRQARDRARRRLSPLIPATRGYPA